MEPLFFVGFRRELRHDDLYAHPSETDSEKLLERFNQWVAIIHVGIEVFVNLSAGEWVGGHDLSIFDEAAVMKCDTLTHGNYVATGTLSYLAKERVEDGQDWLLPFWNALGWGWFFMECWCLWRYMHTHTHAHAIIYGCQVRPCWMRQQKLTAITIKDSRGLLVSLARLLTSIDYRYP